MRYPTVIQQHQLLAQEFDSAYFVFKKTHHTSVCSLSGKATVIGSLLIALYCFLSSDLRGAGMDPGCFHAGGPSQPAGLGDVCVYFLLHSDLSMDGDLRLRGAPKQEQLGNCGKLKLTAVQQTAIVPRTQ